MKKYVSPILSGFLTAYALLVGFHAPLIRDYYDEGVDYITTSVYELLGSYSFVFLPVFILCFAAFVFFSKKGYSVKDIIKTNGKKALLPALLSVLLAFTCALGICVSSAGTGALFGSLVNAVKAVLATIGFALFFFPSLSFLRDLYQKASFVSDKQSFFEKHAFLKAFGLMSVFYLPFLILSFPGNLCYDVIGQIEQVLRGSFSTHHPLVHTLWVGGMAFLGKKVFSSMEAGIFLYVVTQTLLLIAAFAAAIAFLAGQKVKSGILWCLLILFCITPIYTNLATTAVKDVPFAAFVLLYYIVFLSLLQDPKKTANVKYHIVFVLLQIGVITMRNNGLVLIALSGIGALIYLLRSKTEKKPGRIILFAGAFFAESILIAGCILSILSFSLSAEKGSRGEMLSLPFQQVAYTVRYSDKPLSEKQYAAIETVLTNPEILAENYNPDIADPVKAFYKKDSTLKENLSFLASYAGLGLSHPVLYAKAFVIHTYGWYTPSVSNVIRYETEWDALDGLEIFPGAHKVMIFLYRFLGRMNLFGLFENIGFAVWVLAFLTWVFLKNKKNRVMTLPLWIHFLVCLASPCFVSHPRYGLPILMLLPILFIYAKITADNSAKKE